MRFDASSKYLIIWPYTILSTVSYSYLSIHTIYIHRRAVATPARHTSTRARVLARRRRARARRDPIVFAPARARMRARALERAADEGFDE